MNKPIWAEYMLDLDRDDNRSNLNWFQHGPLLLGGDMIVNFYV